MGRFTKTPDALSATYTFLKGKHMNVIYQFNTNLPAHFEANRTQVNVGITATTKTIDEEEVDGYGYCTVLFEHPESYTDDALFEIAKKAARGYELSKLIIEVDGYTLDADETSQERLSRSYTMLGDTDVIAWKDANNVFVQLGKTTLKNAVLLAGTKQTELWVKYA